MREILDSVIDPLHFLVGAVVAVAGLLAARRVGRRVLRCLLMAASMAVSVMPTIVALGHGARLAPLWYTIPYYLGDDPVQVEAALGLAVLPAVVAWIVLFGLMWLVSSMRLRLKSPASPITTRD
jgi:hypothetical protein